MSPGALVVFGWAAFNALLTAVLVGYSAADPFPLIVYALGVTLVGLFGTAVLLAGRRDIPARPYRMATRSTSAAFLAAAAGFVGLGFTYGTWLMVVAIVPLVATVVLARQERIPATVRPVIDESTGRAPAMTVPVDLPRPPDPDRIEPREGAAPTGLGRAAGVAVVTYRILHFLRGRRS